MRRGNKKACPHTNQTRVIDKLGDMTAGPDGRVTAPIKASHVECLACGETLYIPQEPETASPVTVKPAAKAKSLGNVLLGQWRAERS